MAAFASSSSSSFSSSVFSENSMPIIASSSSSVPPPLDDNFEEEDFCSICLEPFNSHDPATITNCKHEYHLHCILEWSQRSKECPICWQLLSLKDSISQELLVAVGKERPLRSRRMSNFQVIDDEDEDGDSDSHLTAAANRARLGREIHRHSGLDPSQVLFCGSPANSEDHTYTTSSDERQNLSYVSSDSDSPPSVTLPALNAQSSRVVPSTDINGGTPFKTRVLYSQPPSVHPQRPSPPSETSTLSDLLKSKWSAASARYKESLSKSTRGLKEKLLARNNSVKELSKGVQREMSAGIAGVARMIERFDLTPKRADVSRDGVASNTSTKGKGVLENIIVQSLSKNNSKVADEMSSDAASHPSIAIPGRVEVFRTQRSEQ
ncbi:E3 ubiquitin-protein ligase RHF1A isoform X2 [Humulus lupulus]|uniref:E3 ubiquitin-protein ligase RHF1A isoform X2 n=1 Tax=Humulus lupulus TaxID=3486 RepID=UPI002B40B307|nr:E3 ubiquitin-protein ligase RHF1A isoform X2 [Humulus lupulus]